jgi:hypothetical protein
MAVSGENPSREALKQMHVETILTKARSGRQGRR